MSQSESFLTLAARVRHEIPKVRGSRFVATAAPVQSPGEIEEFLRQVRKELHDASHHPYAWRLRDSSGLDAFRSSDDGEPSSSSGKPILQQIDSKNLTQIVVVVTRYFGGTKLGVGGLVRAYGEAAREVLSRARVLEVFRTQPIELCFPYEFTGRVQGLLTSLGIKKGQSTCSAAVTLIVEIRESLVDKLLRNFAECTGGQGRHRRLERQ